MTNHPHDALFKAGFEDPSNLPGLYRGAYPQDVYDLVDWSSATAESATFIDEELADKYTDLLFSAQLRGTEHPLYLYLLLEHQSTNDHFMSLRIYSYLARLYERHRKQHGEPLAHVLPLVVSHAPGGWTAPRNFSALFHPPAAELPGLMEVTPQLSIAVLDLAHMSNREIKRIATTEFAMLVLWLLRDGRDWQRLRTNLRDWAGAFIKALRTPSGVESVAQLLRYVWDTTEGLQYREFRATIAEQLPEAERVTMTVTEELMQRGRQQGRHAGTLQLLARQLTLKFGELDADARRRLATASEEQLIVFAERVLTATSLESVLSTPA